MVESTFDAIRIEQTGHAAIASLGSSLSKSQVALLDKTFTNVVLLPDNDEAGRSMAEKLVNQMGTRVNVIKLPQSVKDVGDLTDDDISHILSNADPLTAFMNLGE